MIALQLNGARCRAKGVHEKSEQWSLLQPYQWYVPCKRSDAACALVLGVCNHVCLAQKRGHRLADNLRASSFLLILKTQTGGPMTQTTTMTVRISGALSEFVASNVGENGSYENISEYVRDLIRRDKERAE